MCSDENIEICDIMRLLPTYQKVRALWYLKDDKYNAKKIADTAFKICTLHTNMDKLNDRYVCCNVYVYEYVCMYVW